MVEEFPGSRGPALRRLQKVWFAPSWQVFAYSPVRCTISKTIRILRVNFHNHR